MIAGKRPAVTGVDDCRAGVKDRAKALFCRVHILGKRGSRGLCAGNIPITRSPMITSPVASCTESDPRVWPGVGITMPSVPNALSRYGASTRITGFIASPGAGACFPIMRASMRPRSDAGTAGRVAPVVRASASLLWTSTGAPVAPARAVALPK